MLKFRNENDFSLVERFKQNDDGSVSWWYQNSNGIIWDGFTRQHEVQVGTEQVQVGETDPQLDENGDVIVESQPIFEEQPVFETQTIDVWAILQAKIIADEITVEQKTAEEIEADVIAQFKTDRQAQLDSATVTTQAGNEYDADEKSITRMGFAIVAASAEADDFEILWSLADTGTGVMSAVSLGDLKEAQALAVQNMADIWAVE